MVPLHLLVLCLYKLYLHFLAGLFLLKEILLRNSINRRLMVTKISQSGSLGSIGGTRRSEIFCELEAIVSNRVFLFKNVTLLPHIRSLRVRCSVTARHDRERGLCFSATVDVRVCGVASDNQIVGKIQQITRNRF